MCNSNEHMMPRSFLVKNYFKKNETDEEDNDNNKKEDVKNELNIQAKNLDILSYPAEYLEYAASLLALSKSNWLQWDYELEKSYWFDTSNKVQEENENTEETKTYLDLDKQTTVEVKNSSTSNEVLSHPFQPIQNNLNQFEPIQTTICDETKIIETLKDTSQFILHNTFSVSPLPTAGVSIKSDFIENKSPGEVSTTSFDSGHESNLSIEENLEEKLSQMLGEDMEVITRNIRQFLDNNQIPIDDISIEAGLPKDDIESFMQHGTSISDENKTEFYKWYLTKILRPPNENVDQSYTCYKCGKIFTYKSYLERHIKYVCPDSSGRTWKCSFCGKAFQYPCYLRRHIRSHTGESPYKCDKCDRAFVRSTDLQRHIRNHTGEKPYSCTQCSRAFARSTDLKRHMRTHTGEKPYKCWQCGKSFSQSGSLQTHLHTHKKAELQIAKQNK